MINFFRTIRRRLLKENRVTRYLLYAIGEIALVVIGILIALQVNNWNEQRKMVKSANSHLTVLERNLQEDLEKLTEIDATLEETLRSLNGILKRYKGLKPVGDTILYEIVQAIFEYNFTPNKNGINILVSSGEIGVLPDSLQSQINHYYNTVDAIQERDQISNNFIKSQYESYIFDKYNFIWSKENPHPALAFYEDDTRETSAYNFDKILNDKKLEGLLFGRRYQTNRQHAVYARGIEDIKELIDLIANNIN